MNTITIIVSLLFLMFFVGSVVLIKMEANKES